MKPLKRLTQEEMHAAAVAAEEAAKVEQAAMDKARAEEAANGTHPPAPEPAAQPAAEPPAPEPVPVKAEEASSELNGLKAQVAERDAKIAELTKRVNDNDGERGGQIRELRQQVNDLGDRVKDLFEENRALKVATVAKPAEPATPPPPDDFAEEYPDLSKGIDRRTKPIMDEAAKALAEAKKAREDMQKLREEQRVRDYNAFLGEVKKDVPNLDEINTSTEFQKWLAEQMPGMPRGYIRDKALKESAAAMDTVAVIELLQQFEQTEKKETPEPEPQKGPKPPSKEAQRTVPEAKGAAAKPDNGPKAARLKQLENKLYRRIGGTITKDELTELDGLRDAEAAGTLT